MLQSIVKKQSDHQIKHSPVCGQIHEILSSRERPNVDIAMVVDMRPTTGHYHSTFEEIYMILDGHVRLRMYDPKTDRVSEETLRANELAVFTPGIHHRVVDASEKNRTCVISLPGFDPNDEHVSDKI